MTMLQQIPFYYLRHGQTDWNLENRAMGQTDIPLNSNGINQAIAARSLLIGSGITTICHSPLARAKMTAEIFNEVLDCTMVEIAELGEFDLGQYAGKLKGPWLREWRSGAELEGAESYQRFLERSLRGINLALSMPGMVLIVAHGGVYWSIEHALQITLEKSLGNCMALYHRPPKQANETWTISFIS